MDINTYMADFYALLRDRKCASCREPCCNVRHPDTNDYDRSLTPCRCCVDYPPDDMPEGGDA